MKKILIINSLYYPHIGGGAELRIKERAEGLKELGYDVVVLTTSDKKGLSVDIIDSIKVYRAEIKNIYWHFHNNTYNILKRLLWHYKDRYNIKMAKYVSDVINFEKPDVVICHNLSGWSIAVWDIIKKKNLPLIQFLHDYYLISPSSTITDRKENIISRIFRAKVMQKSNQVDLVIGVSQFIIDKMIERNYFISSKKIVSYNQRNINRIPDIKQWDGVSVLKIGFIGTLCDPKGIKLLIEAFLKTSINASLLIAGTGSTKYTNELKEMTKQDHRISLLGFVKPSDFYKQIDLLVIPSLWHDTLPGVAIESCAYNVPVIASNMGGLPEVIKDGINGKLISPTIENIYMSIMFYYDNPDLLNEQKKNSRNSVENTFLNSSKMLSDYSSLIESLFIKE